jgi:hypothetical protein
MLILELDDGSIIYKLCPSVKYNHLKRNDRRTSTKTNLNVSGVEFVFLFPLTLLSLARVLCISFLLIFSVDLRQPTPQLFNYPVHTILLVFSFFGCCIPCAVTGLRFVFILLKHAHTYT